MYFIENPYQKMIVCRNNRWFGNVAPEKFTCNPRCDGKSLATPDHGDWQCTDKYIEESRQTIKDYHCKFVCAPGYQPKQETEATCDIASVSCMPSEPHCILKIHLILRVNTHTIAKQNV